jgi:hypothetical protein
MIVESPLTRPEDMERLAERLSEITQVDRTAIRITMNHGRSFTPSATWKSLFEN